MHLAIICHPDDQWEAKRIADVAKQNNIESDVLYYENFQIRILENQFRIFYQNVAWNFPELCVFRSANYLTKKIRYEELAYILRDAIHKHGGRILNYEAMKIGPFGKLRQQYELRINQLSGVDTYYGDIDPPFLPVVQKPLQGSSGDGVKLITHLPETKFESLSIYQKVMERGHDYRVIVVGSTPLGAIERNAREGEFVANISKGGVAKKIDLPKDVLQMAVDACAIFELEYAGVDLIMGANGDWHILEINRFAQFSGFEKATGIDVAKKLLDYLLEYSRVK